jgi:hypothetical protein
MRYWSFNRLLRNRVTYKDIEMRFGISREAELLGAFKTMTKIRGRRRPYADDTSVD